MELQELNYNEMKEINGGGLVKDVATQTETFAAATKGYVEGAMDYATGAINSLAGSLTGH